jgi:hypothetical protein
MDEAHFIALRLSKEGFGRPDEILAMPAPLVLDAIDYIKFSDACERAYIDLNTEQKQ